MELISESIVNNIRIRYWKGFDINAILEHPRDGSNDIMVVFFDSIKQEEIVHNRDLSISALLESKKNKKLSDILSNIDNPFLLLYQTHGYTDLVYKSIKNKIETIKNPSNFCWSI